MPFSILPVEEADCPRLAEILYQSLIPYGIHPYIQATWPGLDTLAGREEAAARFLLMKTRLPDPSSFIKLVDNATGSISAFATYIYNSEPPKAGPAFSGTVYEGEDERQYAEHLFAERNKLYLRMMSHFHGPVTEIAAFFVDDSQQKRGAGTLLIQHIISVCRTKGAPVAVIANPTAVGFYEKQGFKILEDKVLDVPERWHGKIPASLVTMTLEQ